MTRAGQEKGQCRHRAQSANRGLSPPRSAPPPQRNRPGSTMRPSLVSAESRLQKPAAAPSDFGPAKHDLRNIRLSENNRPEPLARDGLRQNAPNYHRFENRTPNNDCARRVFSKQGSGVLARRIHDGSAPGALDSCNVLRVRAQQFMGAA
jgi:hypothetical protein